MSKSESEKKNKDTKLKTAHINGREYNFSEEQTILTAAREMGIDIPTLCYYKGLSPTGACRMCVVEIEGMPRPMTACSTNLEDGMKIKTNTSHLRKIRRVILELLVANHPNDCLYCVRNGNCDLQDLCKQYGIREHKFLGEKRHNSLNVTSVAMVRDPDKCILCERCVKICDEIQGVHAIDLTNRGFHTIITTAFNKPIDDSPCVLCGQCARVCPTGALKEKSSNVAVQSAIDEPNIITVAQVAPSISVTIGEEFGLPAGTDVTPKLVSALKEMGFDYVFDTVFGADLTIMEEASELVSRIQNNGTLPMITTCCPAWIKYMEGEFPGVIKNMSTCKSPMSMEGALIKSFWAQEMKIDPSSIYQVAIMPCMAKKFEANRPELVNEGQINTDAVLTTRELARALRSMGIDLSKLPDREFDHPLGEGTGAGKIFGTSGGVMEAALRTGYYLITNKNLEDLNITEVRGFDEIRRFSVQLTPELNINCVAVSGLKNARIICEEILAGNPNNYQFIEIMACPGGCINGGGQPQDFDLELIKKRAAALYNLDNNEYKVRLSHENKAVKEVYSKYFKKIGSKEAHHILHTRYYPKKEENN